MNDTMDRLIQDGKVLVQEIGIQTDKAVEIGRLKIQLMDAKQSRSKQYAALGELCAALISAGEAVEQDADVCVLCERIESYNRKVDDLNSQLDAARSRE